MERARRPRNTCDHAHEMQSDLPAERDASLADEARVVGSGKLARTRRLAIATSLEPRKAIHRAYLDTRVHCNFGVRHHVL